MRSWEVKVSISDIWHSSPQALKGSSTRFLSIAHLPQWPLFLVTALIKDQGTDTLGPSFLPSVATFCRTQRDLASQFYSSLQHPCPTFVLFWKLYYLYFWSYTSHFTLAWYLHICQGTIWVVFLWLSGRGWSEVEAFGIWWRRDKVKPSLWLR